MRAARPHSRPRRHTRTARFAASAALAASLATGLSACAGGASPAPDPKIVGTAAAPVAAPSAALPKSRPTGLKIASAGVDAHRMLDLTTDAHGELRVPDADTEADTPGWWTGGVTPGEAGASVLVAHYDTRHGPALLKDVEKIGLGDLVQVPRADGATATFKIREIEDVPKTRFPTEKVYGRTARPELRLITCGGEIRNGHRTDNIILYADLVRA